MRTLPEHKLERLLRASESSPADTAVPIGHVRQSPGPSDYSDVFASCSQQKTAPQRPLLQAPPAAPPRAAAPAAFCVHSCGEERGWSSPKSCTRRFHGQQLGLYPAPLPPQRLPEPRWQNAKALSAEHGAEKLLGATWAGSLQPEQPYPRPASARRALHKVTSPGSRVYTCQPNTARADGRVS